MYVIPVSMIATANSGVVLHRMITHFMELIVLAVLDHYYHFVAELIFGTWAFWVGTFNATIDTATWTSNAPTVDRAIFGNNPPEGIRDGPGFNTYFMRSVFPSMTIEMEQDWTDRIYNTVYGDRAYHFDAILIADRSAAFKGTLCGLRNHRIAAEAYEPFWNGGRLQKEWWEPIRREFLRFAGVDDESMDMGIEIDKTWKEQREKVVKAMGTHQNTLPIQVPISKEKTVITYISRQAARRHLIPEDHRLLVAALQEMTARKGYELIIIEAEKLSKDEQLTIMSMTTVWDLHCHKLYLLMEVFCRSYSVFTETASRTYCGWHRPDS